MPKYLPAEIVVELTYMDLFLCKCGNCTFIRMPEPDEIQCKNCRRVWRDNDDDTFTIISQDGC